MPIYIYECGDCLGEWKESHGMTETIEDCFWCESKNVYRIPAPFTNLSKKTEIKRKVGDLTKEFIQDSQKDLKAQKKILDDSR